MTTRQYQIPGGPYIDETVTAQYQIPGGPYVNEASVATGVTISCTVGNAVAAGSTAAITQDITITTTVGNAVAAGSTASVLSGTIISCTTGNAAAAGSTATIYQGVTIIAVAGNAVAAGSTATVTNTAATFSTAPLINNTGTVLASQAVAWTWFPGGRIGTLSLVTSIDGTGTTGVDGRLTPTGLSAGAGILMVAVLNTDATDDYVYYEAGTVV